MTKYPEAWRSFFQKSLFPLLNSWRQSKLRAGMFAGKSKFNLSAAAMAALAALAAPSWAYAKPEKGKQFQDWVIECETVKDAKEEKCVAAQTQTMKDKGERLIKFSVGYIGPKGEPVAVAILPLGIYLPAGAAFKVDDGTQVKMTIQSCTADGCSAVALLDVKELREIRAGKTMVVGVIPTGSQETVAIKVSLQGFKPAFDSLK